MCGIAGIIDFSGRSVSASELKILGDALVHRGPDGEGIYCQGNVGLTHRRLAIIDPLKGGQPFFSDDGTIALCYNGEVYNFQEIRHRLRWDFRFRTESDTEVVLKAYEKWGIECLQHFRGMFAFALYDGRKQLMYLVRDRLGIKPLYYHRAKDRLLFCSELAPLLKLQVGRQINPDAVAGFFRYQYVPTPSTIYEDIYKLEPGHFLEVEVEGGEVRRKQYWDLRVNITDKRETEWLEALNAELDDIVRIYVRSDVPFGSFLSGGVDSSLVTALMQKHVNGHVRTFSIGFQEQEHSELGFAEEVRRILGTEHFAKVVSSDLALDILKELAVRFGEPFGDSSAIPTYYVSREASRQVKMVLSGDGGDELFAGYDSYRAAYEGLRDASHGWRRLLFTYLGKYGPLPKLRKSAHGRAMSPEEKHRSQREIFEDRDLRALLVPEVSVGHPVEVGVKVEGESVDPITMFQAWDLKTYLVDDILTKVDRMSMANSLEVRVPLLDHKLVEMAFCLPLHFKLQFDDSKKQVRTKYLLKKSAARYLPDFLLERPKRGFGIPIIEWCRGPLKPGIEESLRSPRNPIFDWVRFEHVQEMLNRFFRGDNILVAKIWCLFMYDLWMREVHLNGSRL